MSEFNLSDTTQRFHLDYNFYCETDVKEFIRRLKEWIKEFVVGNKSILEEIDKIAGEKLI